MGSPDFLAILGPTASGKTGLSLEIARRTRLEVISMDSRQIYRGMDIGTGKIGLRERAMARHHGLDLMEPSERYSAGRFAQDARRWMKDIRSRGSVPMLVGGTGFFLRALIQPLFEEPSLDTSRLQSLRGYLNRLSAEHLCSFARTLDPARGDAAREGGRQRLTRTVEMALLTGRPLLNNISVEATCLRINPDILERTPSKCNDTVSVLLINSVGETHPGGGFCQPNNRFELPR